MAHIEISPETIQLLKRYMELKGYRSYDTAIYRLIPKGIKEATGQHIYDIPIVTESGTVIEPGIWQSGITDQGKYPDIEAPKIKRRRKATRALNQRQTTPLERSNEEMIKALDWDNPDYIRDPQERKMMKALEKSREKHRKEEDSERIYETKKCIKEEVLECLKGMDGKIEYMIKARLDEKQQEANEKRRKQEQELFKSQMEVMQHLQEKEAKREKKYNEDMADILIMLGGGECPDRTKDKDRT